jgi:hypothetical protein
MAKKTPRPVKGRFAVKPGAIAISHEEGFRHAIDNGLKKTGWDPGEYKDVRVEFSATVSVVNPGHIIEYCVILTPPTS